MSSKRARSAGATDTPKASTRWAAIRNGRGEVKGWIEVFWSAGLSAWVTIPGVSRYREEGVA